MGSLLATLTNVIRWDLTTALRRKADILNPLVFFAIVVSLFPLGVGPEPNLLRTMAPGILWVAALLATMVSLGRMFSEDYDNGSLEQMALSPCPLTLLVIGKVSAHWLMTGVPLVLMTPLLAMQLQLDYESSRTLIISLLLGTPTLSLIGSVGAALTLGLRGGGVLVSLLVLPLYTPILIFGAGAVAATASGISPHVHLSLLGALLALAVSFTPVATATALRISLD